MMEMEQYPDYVDYSHGFQFPTNTSIWADNSYNFNPAVQEFDEEDDEEEEEEDEVFKCKLDPNDPRFNGDPYDDDPFFYYQYLKDNPSSSPAYTRLKLAAPLLDDEMNNFFHKTTPWVDRFKQPKHAIQDLAMKEVVRILRSEFHYQFKSFRDKFLKASNNTDLYHKLIQSAATVIYMLWPKEHLYMSACHRTMNYQLNNLWSQILRNKPSTAFEVCQTILSLIGTEDFSFVTESDLNSLLVFYCTGLICDILRPSYKVKYPPIENKDQIYYEIKNVVKKMKPFRPKSQDDFTRSLIRLLRGVGIDDPETLIEEERLIAQIMNMVDIETMEKQNPELPLNFKDDLWFFLWTLIKNVKQKLTTQVIAKAMPLDLFINRDSVYLSPTVLEIIQVAELRRMAVGSRFVNLNHLLWAFGQYGYDVPFCFRRKVLLDIVHDEDLPLYVIYNHSVKLAEFLGDLIMEPEHLFYSVLFCERNSVYNEPVSEAMEEHFRRFVAALEESSGSDTLDSCDWRDTDESSEGT